MKHRNIRLAGIVGSLGLVFAHPALGQSRCGSPAGFSLQDGPRQAPVRRLASAIVFSSGLRVNTDGAPNSYHPIGTSAGALNTICNGIAVIPQSGRYAGTRITAKAPASLSAAARCQMILDVFRQSRDAGYAIPDSAHIDWYAIASKPPDAGRYRPCIQESGRFRGFFVAQTARAADPSRDVCDPEHWINSVTIPYITLPGGNLSSTGARPGDLALVHRRVDGEDRFVVAVAGDSGNSSELGEGSIALHAALGNPATGRIPGNIRSGVTTYLFPRRRATIPITAASLQGERDTLMAELGGTAAALSCTD